MNFCYIGVDGIVCSTLKEYEKANAKGRFIYIDAVPDDFEQLETSENYAVTNKKTVVYKELLEKTRLRQSFIMV